MYCDGVLLYVIHMVHSDIKIDTVNLYSYIQSKWRKLHNEELNDLYSLPNIVRVVKSRWMWRAGHVARMGEDRGVHGVLVGKPEEKRP
jgi:hypothetical protein